MFNKTTSFFIVAFIFCFTALPANAVDTNREMLTKSLMVKSGLNHQIRQTPSVLHEAVAGNFKKAARNANKNIDLVTQKINNVVSKSFKPDIITSVIKTHIETEMAVSDLKSVLDWLNSPLGEKITRLEEEASTAAAYKEMTATLPLLEQKNDYIERLRLLNRLDDSIKATESMLDREFNMQIVYMTTVSTAFPTLNLPSTDSLKANFEIYKKAIRNRIQSEILKSSLYTYRDLELSEIEAYIDFIKTDYGVRYHKVVHEGMSKAYLYCAKTFGEQIGKLLAETSENTFSKPDVHTYPQKK